MRMSLTVKICVLGGDNVGKTALVVRFITRRFIGLYTSKSDHVYRRKVSCGDRLLNLDILDTTRGCEVQSYSNWADCYVFIYAVNDRNSFDHITQLHQSVANGSVPTSLLLGNKADLSNGREVPYAEGEKLGESLGCQFYEISVSDGNQISFIDEIFCGLLRHHMLRRKTSPTAQGQSRFKRAIAKVIRYKPHINRINSV